jgi:ABC-type branched-subunit amino acid transport system substrate-binding protein
VAQSLATAVLEALSETPPRLALVATTDHASRQTAKALRQELGKRGRLPNFQFEAAPGATDLNRHLEALTEAHPAVVIVVAGAEDAARLVTALRSALPKAKLFGGPSLGRHRFRQLAGGAAEGIEYPELTETEPNPPERQRFAIQFAAERHRAPDYAALLTYDATRLLVEAIRRAGPNRAQIREALVQLSPWSGLGGEIAFDGTGQNTRGRLWMVRIPSGHAASSSAEFPVFPEPRRWIGAPGGLEGHTPPLLLGAMRGLRSEDGDGEAMFPLWVWK